MKEPMQQQQQLCNVKMPDPAASASTINGRTIYLLKKNVKNIENKEGPNCGRLFVICSYECALRDLLLLTFEGTKISNKTCKIDKKTTSVMGHQQREDRESCVTDSQCRRSS
jgi:hypothetical protein